MKASIFFTEGNLYAKGREYLYATKQWFFETPERALNRAYNAALTIQFIENEYFDGGKISTNLAERSSEVKSILQESFNKLLSVVRLGVVEFKATHLILGVPNSEHVEKLKLMNKTVEKLKLIDEVLDNYISDQNLASMSSLFRRVKMSSSEGASQVSLLTIDVQAAEIFSK
ncbi:MAG: hypothetical protein HC769_26715 [Cyanobacteria bacterium CRU_2_1]|nr:hypothetical protein [Cyanobacteria bacterium RU_5_0]NJR62102.1 hypothetical protein [Cyanobacteria bacterium CRU_2_1]